MKIKLQIKQTQMHHPAVLQYDAVNEPKDDTDQAKNGKES